VPADLAAVDVGQTLNKVRRGLNRSALLQFAEPDRALIFDTDQPMAIASRRKVFDMVSADRLMIAGAHLPFPGVGHVAKAAVGYAYVPMPWGDDL
jgi:hypothetical protein